MLNDLVTVYYVLWIIVAVVIIGGAVLGVIRWWLKKKTEGIDEEEPEQIACNNCQRVFTPDLKEREVFFNKEEYAICPYCEEENTFEVDEEDEVASDE